MQIVARGFYGRYDFRNCEPIVLLRTAQSRVPFFGVFFTTQ